MMDRPGLLIKTIMDAGGTESFFSNLLENPATRETAADFRSDEVTKELKIHPRYIVFDYQNFKISSLSALTDDPNFATLLTIATQVRRTFQIQAELRTGLRLFYVNHVNSDRKATVSRFAEATEKVFCATVSKHLGQPGDYGLSFDGTNPAGVKYHLRVGPFLGESEASRYFQGQVASDSIKTADFVCDLDQYQENTKLGADLKWWKPLLISANNLVSSIESILKAKRSHEKQGH
jgi:hypothetical protein